MESRDERELTDDEEDIPTRYKILIKESRRKLDLISFSAYVITK